MVREVLADTMRLRKENSELQELKIFMARLQQEIDALQRDRSDETRMQQQIKQLTGTEIEYDVS